jgi:hypothetical protein
MAVVAIFALDFALIGPFLRGDWWSRSEGLAWFGFSVPVLLGVTIYLLVVPPPFRDWLMCIIGIGPIVAVLWLAGLAGMVMVVRQRPISVLVYLPITFLWLYIICGRVLPKRCPRCRRLRLLRDPGADEPDQRAHSRTYWCCSCGIRFRRRFRSPWERATLTEEGTCAPTVPSDSASRSAG